MEIAINCLCFLSSGAQEGILNDPKAPSDWLRIDGIDGLVELALNLQWSWNHAADKLWEALDEELWATTQNPWVILRTVSHEKIKAALGDVEFRSHLDSLLQRNREGNYSRIGIERVVFNDAGDPVAVERLGVALEPEADYEHRPDGSGGCEDPRVTYVEPLQRYIMSYTAFSPSGPRIAFAQSEDLLHWKRLGLATYAHLHGIELTGSARRVSNCQIACRRKQMQIHGIQRCRSVAFEES